MDLAEYQECDMWRSKAYKCKSSLNKGNEAHGYIPISWTMSPTSKHVSMIMCKHCFHTINISEMYKHRSVD